MDPNLFGELIDVEEESYPYTAAELKSDYIVSLYWAKTRWEALTACRINNADMFPVRNDKQRAVADKVCSQCDYNTECLLIGIAHDNKYGVWGGTSEKEREALTEKFWLNHPEFIGIWNQDVEVALENYCAFVVDSRGRSMEGGA